jgi:hypothetical protein
MGVVQPSSTPGESGLKIITGVMEWGITVERGCAGSVVHRSFPRRCCSSRSIVHINILTAGINASIDGLNG